VRPAEGGFRDVEGDGDVGDTAVVMLGDSV
jgi:hypothetical protein